MTNTILSYNLNAYNNVIIITNYACLQCSLLVDYCQTLKCTGFGPLKCVSKRVALKSNCHSTPME